jgi:hypothetical protein
MRLSVKYTCHKVTTEKDRLGNPDRDRKEETIFSLGGRVFFFFFFLGRNHYENADLASLSLEAADPADAAARHG